MKKNLLLTLLLLLFSFGVAYAETPSPAIVINTPVFNFGKVREGSIVEHEFKIQNQGNATLEVEKIYPACGCTVAVLSSDSIASGGEGSIKVTFDTEGFNGFKAKNIRIYTNDPQKPSSVVSLEGEVIPDIVVEPYRISFGNIRKGDKREIRAVVKPSGVKNTKILEVTSRNKNIVIRELDLKDGAKEIFVSLSPEVPIGVFRADVVIKTSDSENPIVPLPIFARIDGDLKFEPSDLGFGLIDGPISDSISKVVKLNYQGPGEITITDITSDNKAVSASILGSKKGKEFDLNVTLEPGAKGAIRARVVVKSDIQDSKQQKVELPVYGIVTEE